MTLGKEYLVTSINLKFFQIKSFFKKRMLEFQKSSSRSKQSTDNNIIILNAHPKVLLPSLQRLSFYHFSFYLLNSEFSEGLLVSYDDVWNPYGLVFSTITAPSVILTRTSVPHVWLHDIYTRTFHHPLNLYEFKTEITTEENKISQEGGKQILSFTDGGSMNEHIFW